MTVSKAILKKKRQQAVIKFVSVGGGTSSVTLSELALADETMDVANVAPNVNISHAYFCVDATTSISRSGNVVLALTGEDNWDFSQETGFVISDGNTEDISINFGSGNGTVIITVTKAAGYREPDRQILQQWER